MKWLKWVFAVWGLFFAVSVVPLFSQDGGLADVAMGGALLCAIGWVLCDIALNVRSLKSHAEGTDSSVGEG